MKSNKTYLIVLLILCFLFTISNISFSFFINKSHNKIPINQNQTSLNSSFDIPANYTLKDEWIIFQTNYGIKPSDFYLMAFNTINCDLVLIHKGFHKLIFTDDEYLYFAHCSKKYKSSFDNLSESIELDSFPEVILSSRQVSLSQLEQTSTLHNIDFDNIRCVYMGSFIEKSRKEIIFITSKHTLFNIYIFSTINNKLSLVSEKQISLKANVKSEDIRDTYQYFKQAVFIDLDKDNLLETVILAHQPLFGAESNYSLSLVDFSDVDRKFNIVNLLNPTKRVVPGLIIEGESLYNYELKEIGKKEFENVYQIVFSSGERKYRCVSMKDNRLLDNRILMSEHMHGIRLTDLEWNLIEKPLNNRIDISKIKSNKYPDINLPSIYVPGKDDFSNEELRLIVDRNRWILNLRNYLDTSINPLISVVNYIKEANLYYSEKYTGLELIENISFMHPINIDKKSYAVVCFDNTTYDGFTLAAILDESFNISFPDFTYLIHESLNQNFIVASINQPDYFFIGNKYGRGWLNFDGYLISNSKIESYPMPTMDKLIDTSINDAFLRFDSRGEPLFELLGRNSSILSFSHICIYGLFDPWSGVIEIEDMKPYYKDQLDYLYTMYNCSNESISTISDSVKYIETIEGM